MLRYNAEPIVVASKAIDVLVTLLIHGERFVAKDELMETVWPDLDVDEANLTQNIYLLRKLFKQHQSGISIENVPKQGYRLVAPPARMRPARPLPIPRRAMVAFAIAALVVAGLIWSRPRQEPIALSGPALQEYILARDGALTGSPLALRQSATRFSATIRLRPDSALGYAGLAEDDTSLSYYARSAVERAHLQAAAVTLARKAVDTDGSSAEAFSALGAAEFSIEHDLSGAARHFQRALELNPNQLNALEWYGTLLVDRGDVAESRRLLTRAVGLSPNSAGSVGSLAWTDFIAGDYLSAIELSRQQLVAGQQPVIANITLANAYLRSRDYRAAEKVVRLLGRSPQTNVIAAALNAQLDAAAGRRSEAAAEVTRLADLVDPRRIDSWDAAAIAAAYVSVRDPKHAMIWLTRVDPWERGQIREDPRFATLSRDPAFASWLSG